MKSCREVTSDWDEVLGDSADQDARPEMDILLNRWLLYQTLSCRIWARAAFYQLSGAYGFRDQLQDVMALTVAKPKGCARAYVARGDASICRRATFSIGGIRLRAAACARECPMTVSGCHMPLSNSSRPQVT